MTTLNTIIEEEKKEFDATFDLNNVGCSECSGTELVDKREVQYPKGKYHCEWDLEKVKDFLTTAMQRAYEAGREEEGERILNILSNLVPKDEDAMDVINDWIIPELKRAIHSELDQDNK